MKSARKKSLRIPAFAKVNLALNITGKRTDGYHELRTVFQAISLETDADDAKLLAFSALSLIDGVKRVDHADLELTAIVEPIRQGDSEDLSDDRIAQYRFAVEIMEEHTIRVMTSSDLPRIAETARRELRV